MSIAHVCRMSSHASRCAGRSGHSVVRRRRSGGSSSSSWSCEVGPGWFQVTSSGGGQARVGEGRLGWSQAVKWHVLQRSFFVFFVWSSRSFGYGMLGYALWHCAYPTHPADLYWFCIVLTLQQSTAISLVSAVLHTLFKQHGNQYLNAPKNKEWCTGKSLTFVSTHLQCRFGI